MINIQPHLAVSTLYDETELTLKLYPFFAKQQPFTITSTGEGHSFAANGLYDYLDKLCSFFNFNKADITIETWNLLEQHNEYNIKIKNEIYDCHYFADPSEIQQPTSTKIGIFLGRCDYQRLQAHTLIHDIPWRDQLIYTFHNDFKIDRWPQGLSRYLKEGGSYSFIEDTTPCSDIKQTVSHPIIPPANIFGLEPAYEQIMFEVAFETVFYPSFFVTEKTLRPIFYGRPFLVVGPRHFEDNMEKLGFDLDFNFPFEYTNCISIDKLNLAFDKISNWYLKTNLIKWFSSIMPKLKHNQEVLKRYADANGFIDPEIVDSIRASSI